MVSLEGRAIINSGPGHHGEPSPVRPYEPELPVAYPVCHKNLKAYILIQGIVPLLEVQKYLLKYRLPHGCELLYQIGLKSCCPHPASRLKPVHHVMEHDFRSETLVQKSGDFLPKYLYEANPPGFPTTPLGNQDNYLPSALVSQLPTEKRCLYYGNYLLPVGGAKRFLPRRLMQPLTEVFRLNSRRSARAVQTKHMHRPVNILVFRYRVLDK